MPVIYVAGYITGTIAYILAAHETAKTFCMVMNLPAVQPNSTSLSLLQMSDDTVGVMTHKRFKFCSASSSTEGHTVESTGSVTLWGDVKTHTISAIQRKTVSIVSLQNRFDGLWLIGFANQVDQSYYLGGYEHECRAHPEHDLYALY